MHGPLLVGMFQSCVELDSDTVLLLGMGEALPKTVGRGRYEGLATQLSYSACHVMTMVHMHTDKVAQ